MKTASQNWTCRLSARRRAGQLILFSGLVLLVLIKWVMPQTAGLVVQTGHSAYVTYLQISPDAKLIASGDLYSLILWDAKTGRQIRTLTEADSDSEYGIDYRSISFNHDWHFLIDGASLVEVSTGRRTKPFDLPFNTIGASALSTDGKMFVATDLDRRYVGVWSTATGQRAAFYKAEGVTFSQNGDLFAAAGPLLVPSAQEEAAMRRAKNRADEPGNLPKPRRRIRSSDNLIHIFSASTQKEIARISRGPLVPLRMTFGSDNKELISVNTRGLKVWSLPTGRLKQNLNANFETIHVNNAARDYDSAVRFYFSPNGNSMVAAGENEITFWERKSAKLRHRAINNDIELLTLGTGGYAFTPDGEIFVNPRGVDLWDVKSGTVVRSFEAQGDRNVADVPAVFSGNGQMLALGRANEVDIWDLSATIPRKASRFRPIVHTISNVSLGLDGRTLALSSDDELVDPVGTASDITDAINGKRSDAFDDAVLVWHLDGSAAPARIDGALFYSNPFSRGSRLEGPFYHAQNLMACQKTEPQVECSIWDLGSGNLKKLLNGYDTFFGHETAGILGGAADMNLMTLSADLNRIALSTRSDRLEFWDITDPSGFELKNKIQIGRITTWDMIPKTAVWKLTVPGTINSIVFGMRLIMIIYKILIYEFIGLSLCGNQCSIQNYFKYILIDIVIER